VILTVFGVILFALGLAVAWYGLRSLVVIPKLLRTDPVAPSAVPTDGTFVVCRGTATPSEGTVAGPFTGERCLGFEFEVSERQPFGVGIPWFRAYLDDGVSALPFRLRDEHGHVEVSPSSRTFSLDTDSTVLTVGPRETPPERIRQFVDGRDGLSPVAGWLKLIPGLGRRWYVERRIDPGEEYVIAGQVKVRQGEPTLSGDLVITDRSPRQLALARLKGSVFPLVVAALFVGVGLFVALLL
jgi:hypothetical protein